MEDYYLYFPCPGSTGTQFYSNVAPTYPGAFIRFDSGSDPLQYGKCYHIIPRTLEVPPTPLVSINWATVTYSFWNDTCDSCVEQAPCGDCPPGSTLVDGECILIDIVPANYTGGLVQVGAGSTKSVYSSLGLRLYPDISGLTLPIYGYGFAGIIPVPCTITIPYSVKDNNGLGSVVTPLLSSVKSKLWGCDASIPTCQTGTAIGNRGRLMETGIWSPGYPEDVELSFEFCVNLDTTKQYLIGIAGDNKVKIYIDSVLHVFLDVDGIGICAESINTPFVYWHVFPITLTAGNHIIKLSGLNLGSEASFGAEIYDIDLATFQSTLTSPASAAPNCGNVPADVDPYVVFSTKDYIGQYIPDPNDPGVWTCPDGYVLDVCDGIPQCTKITTVPVIPCNSYYTLNDCCTGEPAEYPLGYELQGVIYLLFNGNCLETACPDDLIGLIITEISNESEINLTGCLELTEIPESEIPIGAITTDYENVFQQVTTVLTCQDCQSCYYNIFNCEDPTQIICVSNDLSLELDAGLTIQLSAYPNICWGIEGLVESCSSPVTVVITQTFEDCPTCTETLKTYYKLLNCLNPLIVVYTETDLSAFIGSVIAVNEYPDDCWTVEVSALAVSPVDVTGVIEFATCEACGRQFYLLEDCNTDNPEPNIITSSDLSLYVGQVITLEYCPEICWLVSETDVSSENEVVNVNGLYTTCEICQVMVLPCLCSRVTNNIVAGTRFEYYDCNGVLKFTPALALGQRSAKVCAKLWVDATDVEYFGDCIDGVCPDDAQPIKSIRPGYNTPGCTPEKYEKIMCNFSEGIYKQIVSIIYGVTTCCGEDSYRWEIRKELIELKAIEDPNYTCQLTGTCGCTGSAPGLTPCVPDPTPPPPPPLPCVRYNCQLFASLGAVIFYLDCDGVEASLVIPGAKVIVVPPICGIAGQTSSTFYAVSQGPINFTFTESDTLC
jgi:hypothetical protein